MSALIEREYDLPSDFVYTINWCNLLIPNWKKGIDDPKLDDYREMWIHYKRKSVVTIQYQTTAKKGLLNELNIPLGDLEVEFEFPNKIHYELPTYPYYDPTKSIIVEFDASSPLYYDQELIVKIEYQFDSFGINTKIN